MKFSRVIAASALAVSMLALNPARVFADTPVTIAGAMDAQVFPYGVKQSFKITGDTKGKKCSFLYTVMHNGGGPAQGTVTVNAPLPWTSPDLALPGGAYSVDVQVPVVTVCTGALTLTFSVVAETGKLEALTASAKIVATNQKMSFKVSGKNFGTCKFNGAITTGGNVVASGVVTQLPYEYDGAFPNAGAYVASADEIDDKPGVPEGCTGHLKYDFTVIPRPPCPSGYYQSSDDSEFGCSYPAQGGSTTPPSYGCPSGYDKFDSPSVPSASRAQMVHYGCKRPASASLDFDAIASVQKSPPTAAVLGSLFGGSGNSGPATDKPAITGIQAVAASGQGHAARPNSNVFYAGEVFQVNVIGNLPNKAGYAATNWCVYKIEAENLASHKKTVSQDWNTFDIHDVGLIPEPGEYKISVVPDTVAAWKEPACLGKAELAKVRFYPVAAWVTDLTLNSFGFHFNMADAMALPQFCENCDSIFSPAHDRAFLGILPAGIGTSPSGQCAYSITANGGGDSRVFEGVIYNGKPVVPKDQATLYAANSAPPFWNMYNVDKSSVTVTISQGQDAGPGWGTCNILGGKISKTISINSDPKSPHVSK
jgi:hypothetical protein